MVPLMVPIVGPRHLKGIQRFHNCMRCLASTGYANWVKGNRIGHGLSAPVLRLDGCLPSTREEDLRTFGSEFFATTAPTEPAAPKTRAYLSSRI